MNENLLKASDYGDRENQAVFSVLVELAQILGSQHGNFVVVGGFVPSLLYANATPEHIGTLDIDLDLNPEALGDYDYADLVLELESHDYERDIDGLKPFQMRRTIDLRDGATPIPVIIDLLMPKDALVKEHNPPLIDGLRVLRIDGGLALKEACRLAGLGIRFLSEFERGKETAEIGKVLTVLDALGLDFYVGQRRSPALALSEDAAEYVVARRLPIPASLGFVSDQALLDIIHHYGVRRLSLFGSAARNALEKKSDIDLLVEFKEGRTPALSGMIRIRDAFSELFDGRDVDVATTTILNNPYRRRQIERDLVLIYAD